MPPELEAVAREEGGRIHGGTVFFSPVPWIYLGLIRLNRRLLSRVVLDHDLADLAGLVVSQDNSCRYCYAVQRALLRTVGFREERIAKLEETFLLAELGPGQRAALEFARRISRSNPLVTAGDAEPLRTAGLSEPEIRELAIVAGLNLFFNRTSTLAALPTRAWEAAPERWYMPLARPLLAMWVARKVRGRAEPGSLRDDQRSWPFSYLTNALETHPFAADLRTVLDEMWESEHLSRRAKALCFAVVARALGSKRSEREASELAVAEGLSADEVDEVLANLDSPRLDDSERLLVPFSRQTVWYEVPDLQRRAHELHAALPLELFLEAIAVTSLANVVCRLDFLAGET